MFGIRTVRPLTDIVVVELVLPVLENRIEVDHTSPRKQSNRRNKTCNTSCRESSPREADKEYLIARFIIHGEEAIGLTDMLRKTRSSDCRTW